MTAPKSPPGRRAPTDKDVQALLLRLNCPTPLHVLRTLLLGNISSPRLEVSPMAPLAQAWGGELPEFGSTAEAEDVVDVLVRGLWNRLAEHQNARNPFRLPRFEVAPTSPALHDLARMRADELKGFVDGLFGNDHELELPRKAHQALIALAELHALCDGAAAMLASISAPGPAPELKAMLRNLQQLAIVADANINKLMQACKRARGQHMAAMDSVLVRHPLHGDDDDDVIADDSDDDDGPEIVRSPLSQTVTHNGVTVRIDIYADRDGRWILEVVDAENTSHVWDDHFETDAQALAEALKAFDEDPLEFFGRNGEQPLN